MADIHLEGSGDDEKLRQTYTARRPVFERLGINIQQALTTFLDDAAIPYLAVSWRVKAFDSLAEKIKRKSYSDPFSDCEDLCGIRVICYYPSDADRIGDLVRKEFDVDEVIDKTAGLAPQEFGYRSTHYIVKIKTRWLAAPNYRGLKGEKAEIQVRTILMHAWAEIEHKLAYKKPEDVPAQFRRRLSRLSAKFEEADEQFEELRSGLEAYREELAATARKAGSFDVTQPINLDSLAALMEFYFSATRQSSLSGISRVLEELLNSGMTMEQLVGYIERVGPKIYEFDQILKSRGGSGLTQVGAVRLILDLLHPGFLEARRPEAAQNLAPLLNQFRESLDRGAPATEIGRRRRGGRSGAREGRGTSAR